MMSDRIIILFVEKYKRISKKSYDTLLKLQCYNEIEQKRNKAMI